MNITKQKRRGAHLERQRTAAARQEKSARAGAGIVYIDQHIGDDNEIFFSVNFFDGEAGTQRGPFKYYHDAKIEARKLASILGVGVRK